MKKYRKTEVKYQILLNIDTKWKLAASSSVCLNRREKSCTYIWMGSWWDSDPVWKW